MPTRRQGLVETMFGERVADPYRWLENGDDPEVGRWVKAQNQLTEAWLARSQLRPALLERLRELFSVGSLSLPRVRQKADGSLRYFYQRRTGSQNQPVLLVRDGHEGTDRPLVDPNRLSAEGTRAVDWFHPSWDGRFIAYGLSENGSEESTLFVRRVDTGEDLAESIPRTRFSSVCWQPTGKGFYYTRYPAPGSVPDGEEVYHRKLYLHALGSDSKADQEVFGSGRDMTDHPSCEISPDGRWLLVSVHVGWNKTELYLADTKRSPLAFLELTTGKEHTYGTLLSNETLYVITNEGAPRYRLLGASLRAPRREHWKQLLPEHPRDILEDFLVAREKIVASYSHDAVSRVERFDKTGRSLGAVPLPGVGSNRSIHGLVDGHEALMDFETFTEPEAVHRVDTESGQVEPWLRLESPVDSGGFVIERRRAESKDGTNVPFIVARAKDTGNGPRPTLLYGYGGFNISLRPRFSPLHVSFMERGGIYVQANLRGGGEGGEDWHRQGQLNNKQNVFDDYLAVARELINSGVTTPDKLAIYGRSNGGLLVAAALTQAPELFRVAVSAVPLTDMLRYPRFLIAKLWESEYGSPDDPQAFRWLYRYSPYHRVAKGAPYPATMFMTAESDGRVDPAHARKMTAAMQWASGSGRPVLLRTETKAGHGAGKSTEKRTLEYTDLLAFVMSELGMTRPEVSMRH